MMIYDLNANPLNSNEWAFPLTECFHITAFALSIGTIMLVDLRLLGLGMRHQTARQLLKDTGLWTLAGLIIVITSGLLIFCPTRFITCTTRLSGSRSRRFCWQSFTTTRFTAKWLCQTHRPRLAS